MDSTSTRFFSLIALIILARIVSLLGSEAALLQIHLFFLTLLVCFDAMLVFRFFSWVFYLSVSPAGGWCLGGLPNFFMIWPHPGGSTPDNFTSMTLQPSQLKSLNNVFVTGSVCVCVVRILYCCRNKCVIKLLGDPRTDLWPQHPLTNYKRWKNCKEMMSVVVLFFSHSCGF